eukprot:CAMPEP_0167750382 /NCGR_PEP_ID=MMETSP0110_2-20121227/5957_1 /TAXON_ID=629695 /ORGANISM="Gymnochlora sp., Strain CCMP2014" /LENGTH=418 /DNA_ID=CAMNT_0007635691 /DNA_START=32 /DNA_END=1287 /DNA_ORIENTATION=+
MESKKQVTAEDMARWMGKLNLSLEQKQKLAEFKEKVGIPADAKFDGVQDDITCYRFVSAKKWVLEDAIAQYKAYLKYRVDEKVDEIWEWEKRSKAFSPLSWHGYDKDGRPLIYENIGVIPASRFASLITVEDHHKYHTYFMESFCKVCREQTIKLDKPVFSTTAIVDMNGASLDSRHFVPYFKDMAEQDAQNYPEVANIVIIVNSPWIFPALYSLVKPFIDPNTREKIIVYSSSGYLDKILMYVDKKVLNHKYGGENKEVLPTVKGLKVDGSEEMLSKSVAARDSFAFSKEITEKKGGKFSWMFMLESLDINYKVEWKGKKDKQSKVIVEKSRIEKDNGEFDVKTSGVLTLTFDNTFSYLTSKTLQYGVVFTSMKVLKANAAIEAKLKKQAKKAEKEKLKQAKRAAKEAKKAEKRASK